MITLGLVATENLMFKIYSKEFCGKKVLLKITGKSTNHPVTAFNKLMHK